jgi:hypothetical protein
MQHISITTEEVNTHRVYESFFIELHDLLVQADFIPDETVQQAGYPQILERGLQMVSSIREFLYGRHIELIPELPLLIQDARAEANPPITVVPDNQFEVNIAINEAPLNLSPLPSTKPEKKLCANEMGVSSILKPNKRKRIDEVITQRRIRSTPIIVYDIDE